MPNTPDDGLFTIESKGRNLQVSSEKCQCNFFTSMKLPCRHIFTIRKELSFPLYCESLCDPRWTKDHYLISHRAFKSCENLGSSSLNHENDHPEESLATVTLEKQARKKVPSQHEKYRKTFGITQKLATITSEASGTMFQRHLATLQHILEAWQGGREVLVSVEDDADKLLQASSGVCDTGNKKQEEELSILGDSNIQENDQNKVVENNNITRRDKEMQDNVSGNYITSQ